VFFLFLFLYGQAMLLLLYYGCHIVKILSHFVRKSYLFVRGHGFSVFVMLAGPSPARKRREVQATPRRGVACTSLLLLCAPNGARTQAAGVRGEDNGKALVRGVFH